ncbi:MAG: hypothetical protein LAO79_26860, partial [Acidobacteriia bacterium]|nr:hypothetical protein [Terriglobia bacterium]
MRPRRSRSGRRAYRRQTDRRGIPAVIQGLSSEDALRRLDQDGPNEPAPVRHGVAMASVLGRLLNPMVVIL